MAKFLFVCARDGTPVPEARIAAACALLVPDNVPPASPDIRRSPGLTLAVTSPSTSVRIHEASLCLGQMFGAPEEWWAPGTEVPDGCFALVRADADAVELATDAVATRTIFYVCADDLFVASTSQRAIVTVLGSFQPNRLAVSWMISSGALGPGNSWDQRIARMGPDARVRLERREWKVTSRHRPISFRPEARSDEQHAARLEEAVRTTCEQVDLGDGEWRLPLSGGYDSRCLLLSLMQRYRLPCITWGVRSALEDPGNDAAIARALAQHVGVPHEFFPIDVSPEPLDVLFERFLRNGEGTTAHISAYMDGFEVWRRLAEARITGVVRGDEAFGWVRVPLESTVRPSLEATVLRDYYPRDQIEKLGLVENAWPAELQRRPEESLETWRDRLYQGYRIPVILASLNDLKVPYVEIVNPLVSRRILEVVRTLPDRLRTDKVLFRRLVDSITPPIPYAERGAIPKFAELVSSAPFLEVARREVLAGRAEGSLPAGLTEFVLRQLAPRDAPAAGAVARAPGRARWLRQQGVAVLQSVLPLYVRAALRKLRRRQPAGTLAFRAAIVARMSRMLREDAARSSPS